jgi:thiaminase
MGKLVERLKGHAGESWTAYIRHPWLEGMYKGDLSLERFQYFLVQDLPYLADFSRVYFMGFAKLQPRELRRFRPFLKLIAGYDEGNVEEEWLAEIGCNDFSSDRWAALKAREGYMNHLTRMAHEGTALQAFTSTLPCCVGFAEIGDRLKEIDTSAHHPVYQKWIDHYRRPFQREQVEALVAAMEACAEELSEPEIEELERVFLRSVQHQIHVFDAAWRMNDPWPGPGSYAE